MIWKKTWLSYFIWVCYTSIICLQSISVLIVAGTDMGFHNQYVILGLIVLFFLIIAGVYFGTGMNKAVTVQPTKLRRFAQNTTILWAIIPGLLIGVGFRIYAIMNADMTEILQSPYILESFVQGTPLERNSSGITFLYLNLLRIIFSFLGNNAVAALWLQLILQIITAFALSIGLRLLVNRIAGGIVFIAIMIFPEAIAICTYLTPMTLQLLFLSVGFAAIGYFFNARKNGKLTQSQAYLCSSLMGIYYGLVLYADVTGLLLMLFSFSVWRTVKNKTAQETRDHREIQVLFMIISTLMGFFGIVLVNSFGYGVSVSSLIRAWYTGFMNQVNADPISIMYADPITGMVIHAILFLGIFVYFKNKEKDCISGFYVMFLCLILFVYTGIGSKFMLTTIFYHMIIMLITSAVLGNLFKPILKDEITVVENIEPESTKVEADDTEQVPPKITFLHNPLPVPKKHVPKTLDYDLGFEDLEDDYDIKIIDNYEYDI